MLLCYVGLYARIRFNVQGLTRCCVIRFDWFRPAMYRTVRCRVVPEVLAQTANTSRMR